VASLAVIREFLANGGGFEGGYLCSVSAVAMRVPEETNKADADAGGLRRKD
jgi:hypothetical protein